MGNWLFSTCPKTVYSVPAVILDEYIQIFLRPTEDCQKQIDEAVDSICDALQGAAEPPMVTAVAKGGSYGRKTVLKGNSDGTLVIFISDLEKFQDQKEHQNEILSKIWQRLRACQLERKLTAKMEIQRPSGGLAIRLCTKCQSITFDVLPAFDALGLSGKPSPSTYRDLKRALDKTKASPGEFSVCFTELQQNFFNNRPRKLKDLILLVKYWYRQCQKRLKHRSLPPSYALELLTVYAWEEGCREEDFDIVQGLRTVLGLIEQQEQLCVYWTVNYNFEDETVRNVMLGQIHSSRPVILDPTDPTNMVSKDKTCWQLLKEEAQVWLSCPSLKELPGPSWNVLPAPLHETPGHHLDKFIKDFLQPTKTVKIQTKTAVGIISKFLKEICFRHSATKVQKPIRAGSSGKGTALRTGSDADLVVFVDSLTSYPSQKAERYDVIKEIKQQLEAYQQLVAEQDLEVTFEISKWEAPRVLSFSLKSKHLPGPVDMDVLPAFNALEKLGPLCSVYTNLIAQYQKHPDTPGGEFSACFTELQRDFVSSRPAKLKDLLRLVKHWYNQCEKRLKKKVSLPPKYALELLTIYAWEHGSGATSFDTAQGFRTVLELVTRYQQLCVFWTVNYNFENETMRNFLLSQLQKPSAAAAASHPRDPGGRQPAHESVRRRRSLSARGKPSDPARAAAGGKGAEAGPRLPPTPGGGGAEARSGRQRRGKGEAVASTSGVGRARGPPPPGPSAQLGSRSPEAGWGHAAPLPRTCSSHPGLPGRVEQGPRDRDTPVSRSRRWGGREEASSPTGPGAGPGTQLSAEGWLGAAESSRLGPASGDRPCADREEGQTSRQETGPRAGAAASLPSPSRGIQGI